MRKTMIQAVAAAAAMFSILASGTGCQRRPLNDETDKLYLSLEVDYTVKYNPPYTKPEAYRVLFFDKETDEIIKEEYVSPTGGAISVPPGTYNIVAVSMGAEFTKIYSADGFANVLAYTDKAYSRTFTENDIVDMPDIIFTSTLENEVIPVRGTSQDVYTVYMHGQTPIETGKVIIRGVKGLKFISAVSCVISNLAEAKVLPTDAVIEEPVAIPVDLNVDTRTGEITNIFCSFGKIPNERKYKNELHLLIEDTAGNRFMQTYDVTDQVYACDTKDIIIIIDTDIEIPDPGQGGSGGGLAPVVGDWDDVHTSVPINMGTMSGTNSYSTTSANGTVGTDAALCSGAMPTDRDFRMSGYFNASSAADSQNYFTDVNFTYDSNSGVWRAADAAIFWPLAGTLDLMAFTTADNAITPTWGTAPDGDRCASRLSLTGFDDTKTLTDDILAGCSNAQVVTPGGVPMEFRHAKTLIAFTAKADEDNAITIKGITINDVNTIESTTTLNLENTGTDNKLNVSWSGLSATKNDVEVPGLPASGYVVPLKAIDTDGRMGFCGIGGEGIMLPAQPMTSFTVYYTEKGTEGILSHTYDCRIGEPDGSSWETGRRYVYELVFKTNTAKAPEGFVDLGVAVDGKRVFWAEKNLGADAVTDAGDYYMWGAIAPNNTLSETTFTFSTIPADQNDDNTRYSNWNSGNGFSKEKEPFYDGSEYIKYITGTGGDSRSILEAVDDAAGAASHGASRIPTMKEWNALLSATNRSWTDNYNGSGIAGCVFTNRSDASKFIFLPAAGYGEGTQLKDGATAGCYRSSSLDTADNTKSHNLKFSSASAEDATTPRYFGLPIRPVTQ